MYEQCKLTEIPLWLKNDEAYLNYPEEVTSIVEQNMRKTEDKVRKFYVHTNATEEFLQEAIKEELHRKYFSGWIP